MFKLTGKWVACLLNPFDISTPTGKPPKATGTSTGPGCCPFRMAKSILPQRVFTGHAAPYPTPDQIESWCENGERYNICLRLAGYQKNLRLSESTWITIRREEEDKRGGDQLVALEQNLGGSPTNVDFICAN